MAESSSDSARTESGGDAPEKPKRFPDWAKVLIQAFLIAVMSASLSFCDSFGFGQAASEQTHETFQALQSAFYGNGRKPVSQEDVEAHLYKGCEPLEKYSEESALFSGACVDRNRIRVVNFTKPEMMKVGWPIPYSKLQSFFENAKNEGARAVFVDLIVSLQRDNEGSIADHEEFCRFAAELGQLTGLASGRRADGYSDWYTQVFRDVASSGQLIETKARETKANPDAIRTSGCISRAVQYELMQVREVRGFADSHRSIQHLLNDHSGLQRKPIPRYVPSEVRTKRSSAAMARIRDEHGLPILLGVDLPYLRNDERPVFPSLGPNGVVMSTGQVSLWKLWILDQVAVLSTIRAGAESGKGYRLRIDSDSFYSPALRLFSDVECASSNPPSACTQPTATTESEAAMSSLPDTLYLSWGGFSNGSQGSWLRSNGVDAECPAETVGLLAFVRRLVFGALAGTSVGRCLQRSSQPYHNRTSFSAAIGPADTGAGGRDVFSGSYLFLGVDADVLGDRLTVPMHGTIPAVNSHAMAFDNLLSPEPKLKYLGEYERWELLSAALHCVSVFLASIVFFYWQRKDFEVKRCLVYCFGNISRFLGGGLSLLFLAGALAAMYLILRDFQFSNPADAFAAFASLIVVVASVVALCGEWCDRDIQFGCKGYAVQLGFHQGFRNLAPHAIALVVVSLIVILLVALYTRVSSIPPSESFAIFVGMSGSYLFVFRDEMDEALKDFGVLAP